MSTANISALHAQLAQAQVQVDELNAKVALYPVLISQAQAAKAAAVAKAGTDAGGAAGGDLVAEGHLEGDLKNVLSQTEAVTQLQQEETNALGALAYWRLQTVTLQAELAAASSTTSRTAAPAPAGPASAAIAKLKPIAMHLGIAPTTNALSPATSPPPAKPPPNQPRELLDMTIPGTSVTVKKAGIVAGLAAAGIAVAKKLLAA